MLEIRKLLFIIKESDKGTLFFSGFVHKPKTSNQDNDNVYKDYDKVEKTEWLGNCLKTKSFFVFTTFKVVACELSKYKTSTCNIFGRIFHKKNNYENYNFKV